MAICAAPGRISYYARWTPSMFDMVAAESKHFTHLESRWVRNSREDAAERKTRRRIRKVRGIKSERKRSFIKMLIALNGD